mmetsp:Transcript_15934/g.32365  ORF Transcript_15934/g.32365 Transcript_15934/m.32365 type:complete len:347 (+) Transcript_15934:2206-3246(+)
MGRPSLALLLRAARTAWEDPARLCKGGSPVRLRRCGCCCCGFCIGSMNGPGRATAASRDAARSSLPTGAPCSPLIASRSSTTLSSSSRDSAALSPGAGPSSPSLLFSLPFSSISGLEPGRSTGLRGDTISVTVFVPVAPMRRGDVPTPRKSSAIHTPQHPAVSGLTTTTCSGGGGRSKHFRRTNGIGPAMTATIRATTTSIASTWLSTAAMPKPANSMVNRMVHRFVEFRKSPRCRPKTEIHVFSSRKLQRETSFQIPQLLSPATMVRCTSANSFQNCSLTSAASWGLACASQSHISGTPSTKAPRTEKPKITVVLLKSTCGSSTVLLTSSQPLTLFEQLRTVNEP